MIFWKKCLTENIMLNSSYYKFELFLDYLKCRVIRGRWYLNRLQKTERRIVLKIFFIYKSRDVLYFKNILRSAKLPLLKKVVSTSSFQKKCLVYCNIFRSIVVLWTCAHNIIPYLFPVVFEKLNIFFNLWPKHSPN